ncbi:hypothetical protein [Xenorhabdus szentirmaii]|uniref:hypothetical protein n=1 Tax=Xenorhabdus szentirmaii TaxID=290112 RepID=UPI00199208FB|nr:hypothetical protein [Xenorhabdus sp. 38]MBD2781946.1 hypothetical protein [Xenorhabdus sp. 38]
MFKFAHLLGAKARAADEHDEDEKARKAKSRQAEEDEQDENAEDDDPDAEDEDDDKKGKKAKKAKKAKSEDDGDDPDADEDEDDDADAEDDDDDKDVKKGRRAEQKRCAKIFGSKYAAGRPDMAAHLAFNTRLSASEAISTLKAMGAASPQPSRVQMSLDERMRTEQQVRLGPDAQQPVKGSASALAQQMTRLYDVNRGTQS